MLLTVPYYSQHIDVTDPEWKNRACGVAALKMALDALGKKTPPLDEYIQQGVSSGAYGPSGWIHAGLVSLANQFGARAERKEYRSDDTHDSEAAFDEGLRDIIDSLEEGRPVLVSAVKEFKYRDKFHLITLVGVELSEGLVKGFYYHDPDSLTEGAGKAQFVPISLFERYWRRLAIFVSK